MKASGAFVLIALCTLAPLVAASGGGSVNNLAPTIESFANAQGPNALVGETDVFEGTAYDRNGEADLQALAITIQRNGNLTLRHNITAEDRERTARPTDAVAGWKVWDPTPADGRLHFEFRRAYGATGAHVIEAVALDETTPAMGANVTVNVTNPVQGGYGGPGSTPTPTHVVTPSPTLPATVPTPALVSDASQDAPLGTPALEPAAGQAFSTQGPPASAQASLAQQILPWFVIVVALGIVFAATRSDRGLRARTRARHLQAPAPKTLESTLAAIDPEAEREHAEMWQALNTPADAPVAETERPLEIGDLTQEAEAAQRQEASPKRPS